MNEEQKKEFYNNLLLEMIEEDWGEPSYLSGLDLFGESHELVASNVKATSGDICSIDLKEIFSEMKKKIDET